MFTKHAEGLKNQLFKLSTFLGHDIFTPYSAPRYLVANVFALKFNIKSTEFRKLFATL